MSNIARIAERAQWETEKRLIKKNGFEAHCQAFGYEMARHHKLMGDALESVIHNPGECVIFEMPPGHAKSTYSSILFPSYFLSIPKKSIIAGSHTAELSAKWGRRTRRIIESPKYKYLYNAELRKDSQATDRFELTNGSEYFACGMLGGVAGHRADIGLLDDPVKSIEEVESQHMRDKIWDVFLSEFKTRGKPGQPLSLIVVMTRRHEDDLIGRILNAPDGHKWKRICLPAIAEANDPMGRKPGEALWPEAFPLSVLEEIKNGLEGRDIRFWNSLYQQKPTLELGDYFKRDWWKVANALPANLVYYAGSDYAVSHGCNDYTVHAIIGYDNDTDDIYIVKIWRAQTTSDVWVDEFLNLAKHYKTLAWAEESGQIIKGVGPFIDKEMLTRNQFAYRQQYVSSSDKTVRAQSFRASMSQGKVHVLRADWNDALRTELLAFPDGTNDDQVDALSIAWRMLDDMIPKRKAEKKLAKDEYKSNMIILPDLNERINRRATHSKI